MGVKERRTKILLMLFLLHDTGGGLISFQDQYQIIFDLSFNLKTKKTLAQMVKDVVIEEDIELKAYKLSSKGYLELSLNFPFVRFLTSKWDKKWRILSYEIPEKKRDLRDKLRRELAGWGLGPWHRSFWITPHPIIEPLQGLVGGKEEQEYIQAFEAEHVFGAPEILIEKVWGKVSLEKQYRELFKKWHLTLSQDLDKILKLKKVVSDYIVVLKNDPGLPEEILGSGWIGFEGFQIFKEIRSILLS
ncbi:MAG: PaaX family transcriptional regulator C-terminal domain-containing protein [Patescibacteria group bacterium]